VEKRDHGVGFGGAILGGVMGKDDAMDQDHSLTSLGLDANVRVHHGAPRKGSRNRQKFWLLGRRIHSGLACARARDRNFKKRTGFGAHPERTKPNLLTIFQRGMSGALNLQDRGDCQTMRKSYKTEVLVG
jgi:hypothetical protein